MFDWLLVPRKRIVGSVGLALAVVAVFWAVTLTVWAGPAVDVHGIFLARAVRHQRT